MSTSGGAGGALICVPMELGSQPPWSMQIAASCCDLRGAAGGQCPLKPQLFPHSSQCRVVLCLHLVGLRGHLRAGQSAWLMAALKSVSGRAD
jgi:hypothetical protein